MKQVMHRRFVCVESGYGEQGHNKYWYITVFDNGTVRTDWGRVGDSAGDRSSEKSFGSTDRALAEAEKQIAKKKKGKTVKGSSNRDSVYTEVEIAGIVQSSGPKLNGKSLEQKAAEQIAKGDTVIEKLVVDFAKSNIHNITSNTTIQYDETTGLFSTPLGVVGQTSIDSARTVLSQIRDLVDKKDFDSPKAPKLIDEYMRLVPQNTGRKRPTIELICGNIIEVDKQASILDSLQASLDMLNKPKDDKSPQKAIEEKIWDITLTICNNPREIDRITKFFNKTRNAVHVSNKLNVKKVFEFSHHRMTKEFKEKGEALGNIWQLWHGTRVGNILSIMAKGMIVPPANAGHCTGRMFGPGIYFSDQSTKSLNYAAGYWSGTRENKCFMFLVDVAMGNILIPKGPISTPPPNQYNSYFAKARQSGVQNNEMIVPHTHQACPRYLIEFG